MELRIALAPDGGLRLILPTGRGLNVGATPSSLRYIQRILRDAGSGKRHQRGYIAEFPTQHVIDIWRKRDTIAREEAAQKRAEEARERAEAEAVEEREKFKELGIDLDVLDIRL